MGLKKERPLRPKLTTSNLTVIGQNLDPKNCSEFKLLSNKRVIYYLNSSNSILSEVTVCYNLILPYIYIFPYGYPDVLFFHPSENIQRTALFLRGLFNHITIFISILALGNNEVSLNNDNKKDCYKVFRVNAIW